MIPNGPVLQRGRLNQVAVHNLDMHMCFQLKFRRWYNAIMKTTFTSWKLRKALDIESNRCTAGSLLSVKPEWLLVYIYILYYQSNMHYYSILS